jgi:hypothetical protein
VAAQYGSYYAHSIAFHTALLFGREAKLYGRNKQLIMAKIMQSIVLSLIFGSIFFQKTGTNNFFLQVSIMFFSLVFIAYSGLAEVPVTANNKVVVKRHLSAQMYPAWSYAISLILVQLPVLIIGDLIFAAILYFMVGLYAGAAQFFLFWFCLFTMDITMISLFKLCVPRPPPPRAAPCRPVRLYPPYLRPLPAALAQLHDHHTHAGARWRGGGRRHRPAAHLCTCAACEQAPRLCCTALAPLCPPPPSAFLARLASSSPTRACPPTHTRTASTTSRHSPGCCAPWR